MAYALFHYIALQVFIWLCLIGWIFFVAKLGERKAERERKKRGYPVKNDLFS